MNQKTTSSYQRVWQVAAEIPEGNVASYGQVAKLARLAGGARRVGRALASAPDRNTLPWHRILKADGKIRHIL